MTLIASSHPLPLKCFDERSQDVGSLPVAIERNLTWLLAYSKAKASSCFGLLSKDYLFYHLSSFHLYLAMLAKNLVATWPFPVNSFAAIVIAQSLFAFEGSGLE
jgi:hypothetical protein